MGRKKLLKRCVWVGVSPEMVAYHDTEWGLPVRDDNQLFEFLTLEGAQAGLSWATILKRRSGYRKNFLNFNPKEVALLKKPDVERILKDKGVIRNRLKVESVITNARCVLELKKEFGSFEKFIWSFVGGRVIKNTFKYLSEIPAETDKSLAMSKELKKRGFKFVGSTIAYAFMQAVGMVNDHTTDCFRYNKCGS
ncbi:MAG: DNA-3-methyladenine glycosylase I [Deltaproteobacteria bacterium]|nr:DNA-3-methyladenine glycosylase I [Deltaproteobacteria bacterium]